MKLTQTFVTFTFCHMGDGLIPMFDGALIELRVQAGTWFNVQSCKIRVLSCYYSAHNKLAEQKLLSSVL